MCKLAHVFRYSVQSQHFHFFAVLYMIMKLSAVLSIY